MLPVKNQHTCIAHTSLQSISFNSLHLILVVENKLNNTFYNSVMLSAKFLHNFLMNTVQIQFCCPISVQTMADESPRIKTIKFISESHTSPSKNGKFLKIILLFLFFLDR